MFETGRAVLYAIEEAGLSLPEPLLVINDFERILKSPYAEADFWEPENDVLPPLKNYKTIVLFSPKHKIENRYLIANSLKLLQRGGVFVCVAENEAGGKTLGKMLVGFGVKISDVSKHKCRVVWTVEPQRAAQVLIEEANIQGGIQKEPDWLWTSPGLFSWNRLDKGTNVLLHHLPFSLSGKGADLGCGIGVLGVKLLQRYKDIKKLTCIDRDARALFCCAKNLEEFPDRFVTKKADLTQPVDLADQDFIVMNPPFHIGKKQSVAIGQEFIRNAAKSLKKGGVLVFVANSHLPYEKIVAEGFEFHRILSEEHGFKIIEAVK